MLWYVLFFEVLACVVCIGVLAQLRRQGRERAFLKHRAQLLRQAQLTNKALAIEAEFNKRGC